MNYETLKKYKLVGQIRSYSKACKINDTLGIGLGELRLPEKLNNYKQQKQL
ncbi:MAG: hypothetical protein J6583_11865 [Gilliamella sp.]|nr:hypothetical protein [Gilliamella sp.]